MKKSDFYFDLPAELIAQRPLANRSDSRLLQYSRQKNQYSHHQFRDLPELLNPGDLLVMNNSKVIPARFFGLKKTGGQVEFLVERLVDDFLFFTQIKASKTPKEGSWIRINNEYSIQIIAKKEDLTLCKSNHPMDTLLSAVGHIPLPPYISRPDEKQDITRYQTVYALHKGSVAAPTAGLHFDEETLSKLAEKGIKTAYTTLHVGAGTFKPVRTESILEHRMHKEQMHISKDLCDAVNSTRAAGNRVIAVGTTALRSLETAALKSDILQPCSEDTDIFIYPGFNFKICDGLITNFHLPESTLLMLVSAFIGHSQAMALYQEAIAKHYRFFSYGDASLLL